MSVWFALLLGLVQGMTEFLPVSSSAHLCLLQRLFPEAAGQGGLVFDVLLHLATLAAVCTAYRQEVGSLLRELGRMLPPLPRRRRSAPEGEARKLLLLLLLGTLPLGLAALADRWVERLCGSIPFIGAALLCTGCLLYLGDRLPAGRKGIREATPADALLVGLMQALAVLPGLSRSGCTLVAGLGRGLDRRTALKYSFLLSLPAILGATLLKLREAFRGGLDPRILPACLLGMLAAGISGCLSIRGLRILSEQGKLSRFRWYCWGLGLICLLYGIFLKG